MVMGFRGLAGQRPEKMVVGVRGLAGRRPFRRGWWPLRRQSCWVRSNLKFELRFINGPQRAKLEVTLD